MTNDEIIPVTQNEANSPRQEMRPSENATSEQVMAKFPDWDILPPHSFINPRIKKTQ